MKTNGDVLCEAINKIFSDAKNFNYEGANSALNACRAYNHAESRAKNCETNSGVSESIKEVLAPLCDKESTLNYAINSISRIFNRNQLKISESNRNERKDGDELCKAVERIFGKVKYYGYDDAHTVLLACNKYKESSKSLVEKKTSDADFHGSVIPSYEDAEFSVKIELTENQLLDFVGHAYRRFGKDNLFAFLGIKEEKKDSEETIGDFYVMSNGTIQGTAHDRKSATAHVVTCSKSNGKESAVLKVIARVTSPGYETKLEEFK